MLNPVVRQVIGRIWNVNNNTSNETQVFYTSTKGHEETESHLKKNSKAPKNESHFTPTRLLCVCMLRFASHLGKGKRRHKKLFCFLTVQKQFCDMQDVTRPRGPPACYKVFYQIHTNKTPLCFLWIFIRTSTNMQVLFYVPEIQLSQHRWLTFVRDIIENYLPPLRLQLAANTLLTCNRWTILLSAVPILVSSAVTEMRIR